MADNTDFNDASQDDVRQQTADAKAPGGDEYRSGNGAAPPDWETRVVLVRGSALSVKPIRWLWDGHLARSKLHVLVGAIGTGKSTIAIDFAAVVTTGGQWPDGTKCDPGDVLVWSDEDDPEDTLLPRFLAAGGDPRRIHFVTGTVDRDGIRHFDPATDIPALVAAGRNITDLKLVIVDPVVTVVAGDSHKNSEVRRALRPLVGLASDLSSAVLGISHHTKGTAGRDPVERITGSLAFGALPRVTMAVARDGTDPERRIFCRTKSNIGPDMGGWEYRLALTDVPGVEGASVVVARWGKVLEGSARALLAGAEATEDPEERGKADEERSKLDEAVEWLGELLKDGPVNSDEIPAAAKQSGIAWRTVERAKTRLGVKSRKRDYAAGWWWSLPEHSGPENDTNHQQKQSVGGLRKPTPQEPSCGAGSTEDRQPLKEPPPSTPLEPSCRAGSTEDRQATEEVDGLDGLRSNLGAVRVAGVSGHHGTEGLDGLRSNLAVVRDVGDQNAQDRQDLEVVGENGAPTGGDSLAHPTFISTARPPSAAMAELPPEDAAYPWWRISIVGANALSVEFDIRSAWTVPAWARWTQRHYGPFSTVLARLRPEPDAPPRLRHVVITAGNGTSKRSFEAHDEDGMTIDEWQSRVLKAHGPDVSVRPAPDTP
jgi:putative DNA primase/helicase